MQMYELRNTSFNTQLKLQIVLFLSCASRIQIRFETLIAFGVNWIPTKRRTVGKWAERKRKMELTMTKTMHFLH